MEELLSLKWNNHCSTFLHVLSSIRSKEQYSDVTLICDEKYYHVHRMVLSTCSDYFKGMFDKLGHHQSLAVVLNDIRSEHLDLLLDYMYLGEVNVKQTDLTALIKTSEFLQIKGLAVVDEEPTRINVDIPHKRKLESPSSRRKRKLKKLDSSFRESSNTNVFQTTDNTPVSFSDNTIDHGSEELTYPEEKIAVKEEPIEVFTDIIACDDFKEQIPSHDFTIENKSKDIPEYRPQLDSDHPDSLNAEDSNFSSVSIQDQSATWEESDLNLSLGVQGASGNADTSAQRVGAICKWCNKWFPRPSSLKMHTRIHTGEKPFVCQHCPYRAAQKAHLQYHQLSQHGKKRLTTFDDHCKY